MNSLTALFFCLNKNFSLTRMYLTDREVKRSMGVTRG